MSYSQKPWGGNFLYRYRGDGCGSVIVDVAAVTDSEADCWVRRPRADIVSYRIASATATIRYGVQYDYGQMLTVVFSPNPSLTNK